MVEVELVDEEAARLGPTAAPDAARTATDNGADSGATAPATRRRPARSPRWWLPVVGVALLATGAAGGFLLARGASGGGLELDRPLHADWSVGGGALLGAGDGVVVIRTGGAVVGYAEDDGDLLWEVELGAPSLVDVCAPTVTTDPATLWCWRNEQAVRGETGAPEQRHAALVGLRLRDGDAVERTMAVPWAGLVAVGEDLVVADRVRGELTLQRLDPRSWAQEWTRGLALAQDSVTGQFDATVTFAEGLVVVHGPTAAVLDADDGRVLRTWGAPLDDEPRANGERTTVTVTAHGFAAEGMRLDGRLTGEGVWYDAAGREVVDFEGVLAEPLWSDGSEPGVVLVTREHGTQVVGVDAATGKDLWSLPTEDAAVLARHEGAVVVATGRTVTSIELLTGWPLWRTDVAGLRSDAGHVAADDVALVMAVQGRAWVFVAVDVRTGEVAWSTPAAGTPDLDDLFFIGGAPRLEVVGDRLVVRSGQGTTWLG